MKWFGFVNVFRSKILLLVVQISTWSSLPHAEALSELILYFPLKCCCDRIIYLHSSLVSNRRSIWKKHLKFSALNSSLRTAEPGISVLPPRIDHKRMKKDPTPDDTFPLVSSVKRLKPTPCPLRPQQQGRCPAKSYLLPLSRTWNFAKQELFSIEFCH